MEKEPKYAKHYDYITKIGLLSQKALTAKTEAPQTINSGEWKIQTYKGKPLAKLINKDKEVYVQFLVGGQKFTIEALELNATVSFANAKESIDLSKGANSTDSWWGYSGSVNIPDTFLSGAILIEVSTTIEGQELSLSETLEIAGITAVGVEVQDFLITLNLKESEPSDYRELLNIDVSDFNIGELETQKKLVETALATINSKIIDRYKRLSSEAQDLLQQVLAYRDAIVTKHFNRYYQFLYKTGEPIYDQIKRLKAGMLNEISMSEYDVLYIQPLTKYREELTQKIEAEQAAIEKAEKEYESVANSLKEESPNALAILENIKIICDQYDAFDALKEEYPYLKDSDGTDPFKLATKNKEEVELIYNQLKNIKGAYKTACHAINEKCKELYNKKGIPKDKALRAKVGKDKSTMKITTIGTPKGLKLHKAFFAATEKMATRASGFYEIYRGELKPIYTDFSHIDFSQEAMSIKAYNPKYDKESKLVMNERQLGKENAKNYDVSYKHKSSDTDVLVDEKGINPEDVDQGGLGDCYFLGGVEALAKADPAQIYGKEDSIITGPDKEGNYTVNFYVPDENKETKRVAVKVAPTFMKFKADHKEDKSALKDLREKRTPFAQKSEDNEIWVQLLEKGLAQLEGSYEEIEGKSSRNSIGKMSTLEMLTGKRPRNYTLPKDLDEVIERLITAYTTDNKLPMATFATKEKLPQKQKGKKQDSKEAPASGEISVEYRNGVYLYQNHRYSLGDIEDTTKGSEILILQNPHNDKTKSGDAIQINRQELEEYFRNIEIN
ncbi:MAG: hypothetical protein GY810_11400 [Aureispira sp.]|nr:hypothetical protein [Aureispira sp.]